MKKNFIIIISLIITIFISGCSYNENIKNNDIVFATWLWNIDYLSYKNIANNLNKMGIDEVYLNTKPLNIYSNESQELYNSFIFDLNKENIKTDALFNDSSWALNKNYKYLESEILKVFNYNRMNTHDFKGIVLNIEPYLLSNYKENKIKYLNEYVDNIEKASKLINNYNYLNNKNLKLKINVANTFITNNFNTNNYDFFKKVLEYSDEIIIANNKEKKDIMEYIDNHYSNKKVKVEIDLYEIKKNNSNKITENDFFQYLIKDYKDLSKYKSFNGYAINDYDFLVEYFNIK